MSLTFTPASAVRVGGLALVRDRAAARLEYDPAFAASGVRINPRWAPPGGEAVEAAAPRAFEGLHGVFADSLPDAWGRELVRVRTIEAGGDPNDLTAIDRLAIVGTRGLGALVYDPVALPDDPAAPSGERVDEIDVDGLARDALALLEGRARGESTKLLQTLGDAVGGARPKILVSIGPGGDVRPTDGGVPGSRPWIVKFRAPRDRRDDGALEAAYADLARAAGIDIAPTMLLPANGGHGFFATQRFDRREGGGRVHMISVAALLEIEWHVPTIDYGALMGVVRSVTRAQSDVERVFRRMIFNVIAHNRDDHAKQHAFLMDSDGTWSLAPAYDLTFSAGPGGEHYLAVNGRGTGIGPDDVRALAKRQSIDAGAAAAIVEDVRAAVADFRKFADRYGVSSKTRGEIAPVLERHVAEFAANI